MVKKANSLESGVECEKLKELKPVLDEWIKVVQEYSDAFDGKEDACWLYNERASVGILAAAAWRKKGWISLEEYSTQKYEKKAKRKNDDLQNGRCDLYVGKQNHEAYFEIEAKVAWEDINSVQEIINRLKEAHDDASRLTNEAGKKIAACFASPYIIKNEDANDNVTRQLTCWLGDVKKRVTCDAIAWVFPKKNRQLVCEDKSSGKDYFFPGVVLILQEYHP